MTQQTNPVTTNINNGVDNDDVKGPSNNNINDNKDNDDSDSSEEIVTHHAAGFRLYGNYEENDIVSITGLIAKASWNNQLAKVKKYVVDKQRYHVVTTVDKTESTLKSALLREDNLKIIYPIKFNTHLKQCIICNKEKDINKTIQCRFCRSIFYCSNNCRDVHIHQKGHIRFMCKVYQLLSRYEYNMIQRTNKLFTYNNIVKTDIAAYLKGYGLLYKGIWRRLCMEPSSYTKYGDLMNKYSLNASKYKFWSLGSKKDMKKQNISLIPTFNLNSSVLKKNKIIKNWKSYFKFKQISMKSPISHFMSYVMTVYFALTHYCKLRPIINDPSSAREIVIHLVGVEIELDILHLFCDLLCLLPGYNFIIYCFGDSEHISDLYNIGNNQNERLFKVKYSNNILQFNIYRAEYSKKTCKKLITQTLHRKPLILIGLNAGFEGFTKQWIKALKYIYKYQIKSIFTEYTITTVQSATVNVKQITHKPMDEKFKINPFRSSLITFNPVSRFCSIQNGWIYTLYTKPKPIKK